MPSYDLCRGSGTVLKSQGGRAARRRALFDGPFKRSANGPSCAAEQRRSTVRSNWGTGVWGHGIPK